MADLDDLLFKTSRTFGASIPFIPEPTRREVTVAYLLFRIADTFEDADLWPGHRRARALEEWVELLRSPTRERAERMAAQWLAEPPCAVPEYLELVAEIPFVLDALAEMDAEARRRVVRHAVRTADGMREYVARMGASGTLRVDSLADLRRYCYFVAGIVGEMLTDLFILRHPPLAAREADMIAGSHRFGEGLQLTNILKDAADDRKAGRVYLPPDAMPDVFAAARAGLQGGADYIVGLEEGGAPRGFVTFLVVPLYLAWATLDAVEARGSGSKVSRGFVARVLRAVQEGFAEGGPAHTGATLRGLYQELRAGAPA
ncbi:MAG TPA: squalene/phytoene synthase family protein [Longimicrobiaceae bacterium]|nr:squalene/phytoene synthase family protein [Longimicrobiaceae bacterium]